MKMKKCLSLMLAFGCLCLSAIGCSNNSENKTSESNSSVAEASANYSSADETSDSDITIEYLKTLPSEMTDEYVVCAKKMNLEIIDGSTPNPTFTFNILSKEPLQDGDVSVSFFDDIYFEPLYSESVEVNGKFAEYMCVQYNKIDWNEYKNSAVNTKIHQEYDSLTDEQFPHFYNNTYTASFKSNPVNIPTTINKMTVKIKDKTYTVDIGNISTYENYENNVGEHDLAFDSPSMVGLAMAYNTDGIISMPTRDATANKDIKIKDIRLDNKSDTISINKVDIELTSNGETTNKEWKKGEELEIAKDTELAFNFKIKDTDFAKNPNYAVNIYLVVEYESDGKTYSAYTSASYGSNCDSTLLYAMYKDNVDFSSYFEQRPIEQ